MPDMKGVEPSSHMDLPSNPAMEHKESAIELLKPIADLNSNPHTVETTINLSLSDYNQNFCSLIN